MGLSPTVTLVQYLWLCSHPRIAEDPAARRWPRNGVLWGRKVSPYFFLDLFLLLIAAAFFLASALLDAPQA